MSKASLQLDLDHVISALSRAYDFVGRLPETKDTKTVYEILAVGLQLPSMAPSPTIDHIAKVRALLLTSGGLLFGTTQEISDAMNKAGMTTTRGKPWTKATAASVVADARASIALDLKGSPVEQPAAAPNPEPVVITGAYIPSEFVQADEVPVTDHVDGIQVSEVAELENILADLDI